MPPLWTATVVACLAKRETFFVNSTYIFRTTHHQQRQNLLFFLFFSWPLHRNVVIICFFLIYHVFEIDFSSFKLFQYLYCLFVRFSAHAMVKIFRHVLLGKARTGCWPRNEGWERRLYYQGYTLSQGEGCGEDEGGMAANTSKLP